MDQEIGKSSELPIKIIGCGYIGPENLRADIVPHSLTTQVDAIEYMRDPKMKKMMSIQDQLSLSAAGRCLKPLSLSEEEKLNLSIYWGVGHLPFEDYYLDLIRTKSQTDGKLDFLKFSTEAYRGLNPLITFKCLPNMPLFHISYNFKAEGRYVVCYPGAGEWAEVFNKAVLDLETGQSQLALVGAVCNLQNKLAKVHLRKILKNKNMEGIDGAVALLLAPSNSVYPTIARTRAIEVQYLPRNPYETGWKKIQSSFPYETGPLEPSLWFYFEELKKNKGLKVKEFPTYDGMTLKWNVEFL